MDSSQLNFDQLRLNVGLERIEHDPEYIKKGTGKKATRRIYGQVPLDDFEKQEIKQLQNEIAEKGITLPQGWNERTSLRFLYGSKFEHEKALEKIEECVKWRSNPASRTFSDAVKSLFEQGIIYTYGRDRQLRPVLIIDFGKVDLGNIKEEDFDGAVTIMLDLIIRHCHVPGKIESNVVILDTRNLSVSKLPYGALKNFLARGSACFPATLHKTFVIEPPFMLRMSWKLIEGLMEKESAEKVELITMEEIQRLHAVVDPSQLEKKFNGSLPNLTTFWPPVSSFGEQASPTRVNRSMQQFEEPARQEAQPSGDMAQISFENRRRLPVTTEPSGYQAPARYASEAKPRDLYASERYTSTARFGGGSDFTLTQDESRRSQVVGRPERATYGASSSPIKRHKDEEVIRQILFAKVPLTPPRGSSPDKGSPRLKEEVIAQQLMSGRYTDREQQIEKPKQSGFQPSAQYVEREQQWAERPKQSGFPQDREQQWMERPKQSGAPQGREQQWAERPKQNVAPQDRDNQWLERLKQSGTPQDRDRDQQWIEKLKQNAPRNAYGAVNEETPGTFGESRTQEKRYDDRRQNQYPTDERNGGPYPIQRDRITPVPTREPVVKVAPPSEETSRKSSSQFSVGKENGFEHSFNNSDLLDLILQEDMSLKDPRYFQMIPEESGEIPHEVDFKVTGRTSQTKTKQHVEKSNSPNKQGEKNVRASPEKSGNQPNYMQERENVKTIFGNPNAVQKTSPEKINKQPPQETYKKSGPVMRSPPNEQQYEYEENFKSSQLSAYENIQRGRDMKRSGASDTLNRNVEEWPSKRYQELPRPNEAEEDSEEEGNNFCGLCVSKRKKKTVKN